MNYELRPVDHITTDAIGPPGKRVFYLQAIRADEKVTLIVEKAQVQSLAISVEEFLDDLRERRPELSVADAGYNEAEMKLRKPIDPAFRVGQLGIGYDEEGDMMVLVAREIQLEGSQVEEPSVARFWCSRSQVRSLCAWGLEVASRGRPICGNCGQPIDPDGHFCPKRNGHKH
ncbi:MAG: DUF3090 domain-containing protein [Anaerolineales bacterium]